jgi:hypothetical protein
MRASGRLSPSNVFQSATGSLWSIAYFLYLSAVIFVGDYYLQEYAIFGFWIVLVCGLPFWFPVARVTAAAICIGLPLAILICLGAVYKNIEPAYYQAPMFMILSILALNRFEKIMIVRDIAIYWLSAIILSFFFLFVLVSDSVSSRTSLIFGPTILYRVVLFFYAVCLVFSLRYRNRLLTVIFACMAFYSVLKIGSRGGIVALLFLWGLVAFRNFSIKYFLLIAFALLVAYFFLDLDAIFSSRAFYFSSDSESSNIRLDKLAMIDEFLSGEEVLFGMSYPYALVGNYPHNIFAEFLIFHGVIAFAILLFFVLLVAKAYIFPGPQWVTDSIIIFSPILVGALFSGSLLDNYFFVAIACYLVVAHRISKVT